MAKDYKNARWICLGLTAVLAIGLFFGIFRNIPLVVLFTLLPVILYEIYRTEGFYTKVSSVAILALLVTEVVVIFMKTPVSASKVIDAASKTVDINKNPLRNIPLDKINFSQIDFMDVKNIIPLIMVLLSLTLFKRTGGIYTKWLAVLIIVGAAGVVFSINPELLKLISK